MAEVTIELIKQLRERTGAGLMDCKRALIDADADLDKAVDILREKGLAKVAKKANRIAAEGLALVKVCEKCGKTVILEVNCETDFVARGDQFKEFVLAIAEKILKEDLKTVEDARAATDGLFSDATMKMGEKFDLRRFTVVKKQEGQLIGSYTHMGGKISSVVVIDKEDAELAKQLAMHIAANNPVYRSEADIPAEVIAHEKAVELEAAKNDEKLKNKPQDILEKILEGKIRKTLGETTLTGQTFLMDDSKTVGQVLKEKGVNVIAFTRYEVGEGIEKRKDDFAAEVMGQIKQ